MPVCIQVLRRQNSAMRDEANRRAPSPPFPCPPPSETQERAALSIKQRAPPPPDLLPTLHSTKGSGGDLAYPPPPLPLSILPLPNEGGDGVLGPKENSRAVKIGKIGKLSSKVDMNTAWTTLMNQFQEGVQLKPVSSEIQTLGVKTQMVHVYLHL